MPQRGNAALGPRAGQRRPSARPPCANSRTVETEARVNSPAIMSAAPSPNRTGTERNKGSTASAFQFFWSDGGATKLQSRKLPHECFRCSILTASNALAPAFDQRYLARLNPKKMRCARPVRNRMFLCRTFGGFIVLASAHSLIRDRNIRNLLTGSEENASPRFAARPMSEIALLFYFRKNRSALDQHGM